MNVKRKTQTSTKSLHQFITISGLLTNIHSKIQSNYIINDLKMPKFSAFRAHFIVDNRQYFW